MPIHAHSSHRSRWFAVVLTTALASASASLAMQDGMDAFTLIAPDDALNQSGEPAILAGAEHGQLEVLLTGWVEVNDDLIDGLLADLVEAGAAGSAVLDWPVVNCQLFDDLEFDVQFKPSRSQPLWLDQSGQPGVLLAGDVLGGPQGAIGHLILVRTPERVRISMDLRDTGMFLVRGLAGTAPVAAQVEFIGDSTCGVESEPDGARDDEGGVAGWRDGGRGSAGDGGVAGASCDDGSIIDVAVFYTQGAADEADEANEDIRTLIIETVADANVILDNSDLTDMRLRLVFVGLIDYTEGSETIDVQWARLTAPWDGFMDNAHVIRDAVRADLVSVWTTGGSGSHVGAGGIPTAPPSPGQEGGGFNAAYWLAADVRARAWIHEIGHNFGGAHAYCTVPPSGCSSCGACGFQGCCFVPPDFDICAGTNGMFDYSAGYDFIQPPGSGTCRHTVMVGNLTRIPHFANPDVSYAAESGQTAVATGVAVVSGAGVDMAATILDSRESIAQYRLTKNTAGTTAAATIDTFEEVQANEDSESPALSGNGQDILYATEATNLFGSAGKQVVRFNREAGTIHLITRANGSASPANDDSWNPAVSADRQWYGCTTTATNLISSGTSGQHLYAISAQEGHGIPGAVAQIDVNSSEQSSNGSSDNLAFSYDGSRAVFSSDGTNLDEQITDNNGYTDCFLRDREEGETFAVDVDSSGVLAIGGASTNPDIAPDGDRFTFQSKGTNLDGSSDTDGYWDCYLRDVDGTSVTKRISVGYQGAAANGNSTNPKIAVHPTNGKVYIAFQTLATNILSSSSLDQNGAADVYLYVYDPSTQTGTTYLVSHAHGASSTANGGSLNPSISADCRWIVIESAATNLMSSSTPSGRHIFLVEISNLGDIEVVEAVSVDSSEDFGNGASYAPVISANGRFIAAKTDATDLFASDSNGDSDIFYRDRGPLLGDLNGDGAVTSLDLDILLQNMDYTCSGADLNFDGVVDEDDQTILEAACTDCR